MKYLFVTLTFVTIRCETSRNDMLYLQTFDPYFQSGYGNNHINSNYGWPAFAIVHPKFYQYGNLMTMAAAAESRSLAAENKGSKPIKLTTISSADPLEDSIAAALGVKSPVIQQNAFGYNPLYSIHSGPQPSSPPTEKKKRSDPNGKSYKGRVTRRSSLSHRSTSV